MEAVCMDTRKCRLERTRKIRCQKSFSDDESEIVHSSNRSFFSCNSSGCESNEDSDYEQKCRPGINRRRMAKRWNSTRIRNKTSSRYAEFLSNWCREAESTETESYRGGESQRRGSWHANYSPEYCSPPITSIRFLYSQRIQSLIIAKCAPGEEAPLLSYFVTEIKSEAYGTTWVVSFGVDRPITTELGTGTEIHCWVETPSNSNSYKRYFFAVKNSRNKYRFVTVIDGDLYMSRGRNDVDLTAEGQAFRYIGDVRSEKRLLVPENDIDLALAIEISDSRKYVTLSDWSSAESWEGLDQEPEWTTVLF